MQKNILIGVSASVAAIKLLEIVQNLQNHNIKIILTKKSLKFVEISQLQQFSQGVYQDEDEWTTWNQRSDPVLHIELRRWADLFIIAPLSANTLGKLASGICNNLLTCVARAWDIQKPFLIAPAMNTLMWNHPITSRQLSQVRQDYNATIIDTVEKVLICGDIGLGAMAEVNTIVNKIMEALQDKSNVQVVCRYRPFSQKEQTSQPPQIVGNNQVVVKESGHDKRFTFDYIFSPQSNQEEVFEAAGEHLVDSVVEGFNGTIIAYGQTGSGKTYTMMGPDVEDPDSSGLIPRMVFNIFHAIGMQDPHLEYTIKISYCEIYLEQIRDLINPDKNNLAIKEDKLKGFYINNLTEEFVSTEEEIMDAIKFGNFSREVGATNMNAQSSRSHAIFMMTVSQTSTLDFSVKTGKLFLVDLAGSEKVGKTGAAGKRLEEAKNINKSLTVLGQVIKALTDGSSTHIPYRDSKLTRILRDSLGGNSKTTLIITCSPSVSNYEETLSTLRFGQRAKTIQNKPIVNREMTIPELKKLLENAQNELLRKDRQIKMLKQGKNFDDSDSVSTVSQGPENFMALQQYEQLINTLRQEVEVKILDNDEFQKANSALRDQIFDLTLQITDYEDVCMNKEEQIQQLQEQIDQLTIENKVLKEQIEEAFQVMDQIANVQQQSSTNPKQYQELENEMFQVIKQQKMQQDELEQEKNALQYTCKSLQFEMEQLQQQIDLGSDGNIDSFKRSIQEEAVKKAQKQWDLEKEKLTSDLYNRINYAVELEQQLSELRDKHNQILAETAASTPRKSSALAHEEISQISNRLSSLLQEKSSLKTENQQLENKFRRAESKITELQDTVSDLKSTIIESQNNSIRNSVNISRADSITLRSRLDNILFDQDRSSNDSLYSRHDSIIFGDRIPEQELRERILSMYPDPSTQSRPSIVGQPNIRKSIKPSYSNRKSSNLLSLNRRSVLMGQQFK